MLSVNDARDRILARARAVDAEACDLAGALGRILAQDVLAGRALPPFDNSAMDGFAVRAADLPGELPVAGVIAAGAAPDAVLAAGTALKIMTGAPMPRGADTVVMREEVDDRGARAVFASPAPVGDNVRRAGEDIAVGDVAVTAGTRIGPGEIGLCAALGLASLPVARRPRVGVLSTGDELVDVTQSPRPGQIVNSNAHALAAQIVMAGGEPVLLGIARDNRTDIDARLRRGIELDVLVTSGGVSVGDFDVVRDAMAAVGVELDFWKVAMKPGKPLAFGVAPTGALVFGLPGNPVSSMVSFELFARPALLAMQGARERFRPRVPVSIATGYAKSPGRAHYVRARVRRGPSGELVAELAARQGSGMLASMVGVNALIELPAETGDVEAGTSVSALLLESV